jgi:hypothetical protein
MLPRWINKHWITNKSWINKHWITNGMETSSMPNPCLRTVETVLQNVVICKMVRSLYKEMLQNKHVFWRILISDKKLRTSNVFLWPRLYRPFALTSQILRVSSRCSLTISVHVQQPHTAQELTILIQNYYKLWQNLLCLEKLYYA